MSKRNVRKTKSATDSDRLDSCFAWLQLRVPDQSGNPDAALASAVLVATEYAPDAARLARSMLGSRLQLKDLAHDAGLEHDAVIEALHLLARARLLRLATDADDPPGAVLEPTAEDFTLVRRRYADTGVYRFPRFTYIHFADTGEAVVESATGGCRLRVFDSELAAAIVGGSNRITLAGIAEACAEETPCAEFLALLVASGLLVPEDVAQSVDSSNEKFWEFHDILFHTRSRLGRNPEDIGGIYPWYGKEKPEPAVSRPEGSLRSISLPHADIGALTYGDISLTAALERRKSVRAHGAIPISAAELGIFLYRTARIRGFSTFQDVEFTSRPYPNGGASYELELYLCVDRCVELERGFYYYDPVQHQLHLKRRADLELEHALNEAWLSSGKTCRPQVLIVIASRFKRVTWKYRGMAYATQLKNCGVLYGNMYLVAESMNLAACGLGLGNPSRFARMSGRDFYTEGSIGEFMLGSRGWGG